MCEDIFTKQNDHNMTFSGIPVFNHANPHPQQTNQQQLQNMTQYAQQMKDRRQNNEQLNLLIDSRVTALTHKMAQQMKNVGKLTKKLSDTQKDLGE